MKPGINGFHFNPENKKKMPCNAVKICPIRDEEGNSAPHFKTEEEVDNYVIEKEAKENSLFSSVSKGTTDKKSKNVSPYMVPCPNTCNKRHDVRSEQYYRCVDAAIAKAPDAKTKLRIKEQHEMNKLDALKKYNSDYVEITLEGDRVVDELNSLPIVNGSNKTEIIKSQQYYSFSKKNYQENIKKGEIKYQSLKKHVKYMQEELNKFRIEQGRADLISATPEEIAVHLDSKLYDSYSYEEQSNYSYKESYASIKNNLRKKPIRSLSLLELVQLSKEEDAKGTVETIINKRVATKGVKAFFGMKEEYEETITYPTQKSIEISKYVQSMQPTAREAYNVYIEADSLGSEYKEVQEKAIKVYADIIRKEDELAEKRKQEKVDNMNSYFSSRLVNTDSAVNNDLDLG